MDKELQATIDKVTERISTQGSERKYSCVKCGKKNVNDYYQSLCLLCSSVDKIKTIIPSIYLNRDTERDHKSYLQSSIFCYGPAGTGKTQFIATIAKELIRQGKDIMWYSFPTLVMRVQCAYRDELTDPFKIILDIAKNGAVTIFDDIGIEKMTDFVRQTTYMLINERYQRQLQTLITSNKSLTDIDALIHPGIASRIAGMCQVLEFNGNDFRVKK